jgi:PiT family inorganic phosphate transporter
MLCAATELGIRVSTTLTNTGCMIGVGADIKVSAVRWGVAREIVIAWVLTIPAAGLLAAFCYFAVGLFG